MIILLLWSNGTIDLRRSFQVKNSWLKLALAIATIVALGTYSDYKEFIYSSFKII
jgi:hypothetical protein